MSQRTYLVQRAADDAWEIMSLADEIVSMCEQMIRRYGGDAEELQRIRTMAQRVHVMSQRHRDLSEVASEMRQMADSLERGVLLEEPTRYTRVRFRHNGLEIIDRPRNVVNMAEYRDTADATA